MSPPTPRHSNVAPIRLGATVCTLRAKKRRSNDPGLLMRAFFDGRPGGIGIGPEHTHWQGPGRGRNGAVRPRPSSGGGGAGGPNRTRIGRGSCRFRTGNWLISPEHLWRIGNTSETFQPHRGRSEPTPRFGHTLLGDDRGQKKLPRFLVLYPDGTQ